MALGLGIGLSKIKAIASGLKVRFQGNGVIVAALDGILRDLSASFVSEGTVVAALETLKLLGVNFSGVGTVTADLVNEYSLLDDPDLLLWGDAQADVTTSGGELTAWADQLSAQAIDPPTVTARPLYGTDEINGLDVLTFRSADPNYLDIDTTGWGSDVTLYFVINAITSTSIRYLFSDTSGTGQALVDSNSGSVAFFNFGANINIYINNVLTYNNPSRAELDAAISNSNKLVTITGLDFSAYSATLLFVYSTISNPLSTIMGDVAATQGSTNLTENNNFLMTKYGF